MNEIITIKRKIITCKTGDDSSLNTRSSEKRNNISAEKGLKRGQE